MGVMWVGFVQEEVELGNLGLLWVDNERYVQSIVSNGRIIVVDIIGWLVVLYGFGGEVGYGGDVSVMRVVVVVIVWSVRFSSFIFQLCNCDGFLFWCGNVGNVCLQIIDVFDD